jgi:hypothetical protein
VSGIGLRQRRAGSQSASGIETSGSGPSLNDYGQMAQACYSRESARMIIGDWELKDWYNIEIRRDALTIASFTSDKDVVIAFGGTNPANRNHLAADIKLALGLLPAPANKADEIFRLLSRLAASDSKRISLVGHSLGGALAQYVGYFFRVEQGESPVPYVTFCAPGITDCFETTNSVEDPGVNYYVQNDVVHLAGGKKTGLEVNLGLSPQPFPACHSMSEVLKMLKKMS